jgi:putative peptidoglycan lipid II flippase
MNNKKIAQTTIMVTAIILISKLSGFFREIALAYAFGTSVDSDAFVLALSVDAIFYSLLFAALGVAFIPVFSRLKLSDTKAELDAFVDSTYTMAGSVVLAVALVGIFAADLLVYLLAPGFSAEGHQMAVSLTRILLPSVFLSFIVTIQGQQLRGNNIFLPSSWIVIPRNLILVGALVFLTPFFGIHGAAYAFLFGTALQVVLLLPFVKKIGYRFHFRFDLKNKGLREILILTLPILLGNTIQTIDTMINRILASNLAEGSMAALNFSNRLSLFIVGLISLGAGTVCYTKMSELGAKKEYAELKVFLRSVINLLNLIVLPATVGMMVLNLPIIKFVFEYGAFDSGSSEMTATALWYYSIGLVGFVLRDIITRAFYALGDAKTPMINGGIAVGICIAANLILVRFMGIGGLALATSISGIVGTLLLLISLRKKLGSIGFREMGLTFFKTAASAVIMGVVAHYLYPVFLRHAGHSAIALFLDIACGIAVYGTLVLFLRIKEVDFVVNYVKRKLKNRRNRN